MGRMKIMTVEEFYNYCKKENITDFQIFITDYDRGRIAGYHGMKKDDIDIGYGEKMISIS